MDRTGVVIETPTSKRSKDTSDKKKEKKTGMMMFLEKKLFQIF